MMNQIKQSYNKQAETWHSSNLKETKRNALNKPFMDLIRKHKTKTLLDAGCGSGTHAVFFAKNGLKVIAVDFSENLIKIARKKANGIKNIRFILANMVNYPYNRKFDAIWACNSLHNMKFHELRKALLVLAKTLNPRGILAITMRKGNFEGKIKINPKIRRFYRYSNPLEIKRLLKNESLKWITTYYKNWEKVGYFTIIFMKH